MGSIHMPVPHVHRARVTATHVEYQGRKVAAFAADVDIQKSLAAFQQGSITAENVSGKFSGSVTMQNWQVNDASHIQATVDLAPVDAAMLLGLLDQPSTGFGVVLAYAERAHAVQLLFTPQLVPSILLPAALQPGVALLDAQLVT